MYNNCDHRQSKISNTQELFSSFQTLSQNISSDFVDHLITLAVESDYDLTRDELSGGYEVFLRIVSILDAYQRKQPAAFEDSPHLKKILCQFESMEIAKAEHDFFEFIYAVSKNRIFSEVDLSDKLIEVFILIQYMASIFCILKGYKENIN